MTPATDQIIAQRYTSKTLEKKGKNKTALQEELGWPTEIKRPVLCFPVGMSDELGGQLFKHVIPGLLTLPLEILVLGKGSTEYGELLTRMQKANNHRIHIVPNDEKNIRKMYAAADMALFCASPEAKDLEECLSYGVVPIAPVGSGSLEDYNAIQETGTAFLYEDASHWQCFTAVIRAGETQKFPFDWRTLQKYCMESV